MSRHTLELYKARQKSTGDAAAAQSINIAAHNMEGALKIARNVIQDKWVIHELVWCGTIFVELD